MSKKALETLFNSRARVRLLRFLFRNYPNAFTLKEITKRLQEEPLVVKKEVNQLLQIGLLVKSRTKKTVSSKRYQAKNQNEQKEKK